MRKILLINGKKRSGKDFVSDSFVKKGFVKLSIAKTLKELASDIGEISYDELEKLKNEKGSFTINREKFEENFNDMLLSFYKNLEAPDEKVFINITVFRIKDLPIYSKEEKDDMLTIDARLLLQHMNIFKIIFNDDDIWVKETIKKIKKIQDNVIISDFRFPNEFISINKNFDNVYSVKIIGKNYYDKDEYDNHLSETSLDDWKFDYHLNNTIWIESSIFWQMISLLQEIDNG